MYKNGKPLGIVTSDNKMLEKIMRDIPIYMDIQCMWEDDNRFINLDKIRLDDAYYKLKTQDSFDCILTVSVFDNTSSLIETLYSLGVLKPGQLLSEMTNLFVSQILALLNIEDIKEYFCVNEIPQVSSISELDRILEKIEEKIDSFYHLLNKEKNKITAFVNMFYENLFNFVRKIQLMKKMALDEIDEQIDDMDVYRLNYSTVYILPPTEY